MVMFRLFKTGKILFIAFLIFIYITVSAEAGLVCRVVSGSCSSNEVTVFKISALQNAHAELPSQNNYPYSICCSGVSGLGNSCSGTYAVVATLSNPTNAHIGKEGYYSNSVCLSIPGGVIECKFDTESGCSNFTILASASGTQNAHVAKPDYYSTKICCRTRCKLDVWVNGAPTHWVNTSQTASVGCSNEENCPACDPSTYKLLIYSHNPGSCPADYTKYTLSSPSQVTDYSWVCAAAKDTSGLLGISVPTEFKIDKIPPVTTDNSSYEWTGRDQTINFTCTDDKSGCDKIKYCVSSLGSCTPNIEGDISSGIYEAEVGCDEGEVCVKTIYYHSKDVAGNWEVIKNNTIRIDKEKPTGSVVINNGEEYTNSFQVTLTLSYSDGSGSGVDKCRYSNDGSTWTEWEDCASTKSWTLSSGNDGIRTVYFQVRDKVGNINTFTDTINLDTTPPTSSVWLSVSKWTNKTKFTIYWNTNDPSGIKNVKILYKIVNNSANKIVQDWTELLQTSSPSGSKDFGEGNPINLKNNHTYYFKLNVTDIAGNSGESSPVTTTVDYELPVPVGRAYDQDGNLITSMFVSPENVNFIKIKGCARDNISGIQSDLIRYWVVYGQESYKEKECGSANPGEEICCTTDDILYRDGTVIKYEIVAKDKAGNINTTGLLFIVTHRLANFVEKIIHFSVGESYIAKVQVRNIQVSPDTITVNLYGYEPATFIPAEGAEISNNGRRLRVRLEPLEERTFYVRILSSVPDTYELGLNAKSGTYPEITDSDSLTIVITYPPSFPGLEGVWIVLLIGLAVIIFRKFY